MKHLPLIELPKGMDGAYRGGKNYDNLAELLRQWRDAGAAILLVTHDVEFVATVADRVLMLGRGGLVAQGTAQAVLSNSPLFAPQVARIFPGSGWLTTADALAGQRGAEER